MSANPLVSILINNYNYEEFLGDAIDSALSQTYRNFEVIVVDDGSTDNSRVLISNYGDKIVPIYKENGGQASAFNAGFSASQGEIICFLDADDIFLPEKLEKVVACIEEDNNLQVGWIFHGVTLVDKKMQVLEGVSKTSIDSMGNKSYLNFDLRQKMSRGKLGLPFPIPATSGMCFTRSCLNQILPMPTSKSIILNDSYIKFVALGTCRGIYIENDLIYQRIHGKNLFTLKEGDFKQQSDILINMAFHMRKNFPSLENFSDNLFSAGLFLQKKADIKKTTLVNEYLQSTTFLRKAKIYIKKLFYGLKLIMVRA